MTSAADDGRNDAFSDDAFLGGRIHALQPKDGFRAGLDSVLVAAAVPARPGDRVLELGSGVGISTLCLAARVSNVTVAGIDSSHGLIRVASENVRRNGIERWVRFTLGDVRRCPPEHVSGFEHVFANPPFNTSDSGTVSPQADRAQASVESTAALADWVAYARLALKANGSLTVIQRTERLDELLAALMSGFGATTIFPLWPGDGSPAKRVIVSSVKGRKSPLQLLPGLVLHGPGMKFTPQAEEILRHAAALDVRSSN
jgi:tRNA1(Val) A37 N6-methylase TrmN6